MAFFDKLGDLKSKMVDAANTAASAAKGGIEQAKENHERKVAEAKALDEEMKGKANAWSGEIVNGILEFCDGSQGGFFAGLTENEILAFSKEFYEKLVLLGSKTRMSCLNMHPYIDNKQVKKFMKSFSEYDLSETPVFYIKDDDKQEILVTTRSLYFRRSLPENTKYFADGVVSVENIDLFALEDVGEGFYSFKCDNYELARIRLVNAYKQDFISLNEFFRCIKERDFEITDEEIDQLIQRKIGSKIYSQVAKYKTYEDELVLFYAGGLDSLLAIDYVACTNHQIIIVDREMLGATANVRQYYYEDITSMATLQNSNSGDLMADVINTALTAGFKLCDLDITVAGSHNKISTLYLVEAQRVVAIYHEMRKLAREAARQPQVIRQVVQQEKAPDVMDQLEKLAKMKNVGILTEEEFNSKKTELLSRL